MDQKILFYILFGVAQACGLISLITLAHYLSNSFSLKWEKQNYVWIHGFVMWFGMVWLYGWGLVIYRILVSVDKKIVKIVHIVIHCIVFVTNIIGMHCIFDLLPKHIDTVHGFFGILTVVLYACLVACSLIIYLVPQIADNVKKKFTPYHIYIGLGLFLFSIVVSSIGLNSLCAMGGGVGGIVKGIGLAGPPGIGPGGPPGIGPGGPGGKGPGAVSGSSSRNSPEPIITAVFALAYAVLTFLLVIVHEFKI